MWWQSRQMSLLKRDSSVLPHFGQVRGSAATKPEAMEIAPQAMPARKAMTMVKASPQDRLLALVALGLSLG